MSQSDMLVFLQNLDRSRLLGSQAATEIWEKAGAETPSVADTQGFAAWLVQQGKLTQYQADKIRAARHAFSSTTTSSWTPLAPAGWPASIERSINWECRSP